MTSKAKGGNRITTENQYTNIWRFIPFRKDVASINMAIDEVLLNEIIKKKSKNTVRFYQWERTTASLGRNQSLFAEVNVKEAKNNNVDVVRRISGGGAVLHDKRGELTYSIVCPISQIPKVIHPAMQFDPSIPQRYQTILEALSEGLRNIGIRLDAKKIHCPALTIDGKKVSGNAQAIRNNVLLQHGTILLSVNPKFMYKILKAPKGASYTKMVQSVRSKVTGINKDPKSGESKLEKPVSPEILAMSLKRGFERVFDIKFVEKPLTNYEIKKAKELAKKKYEKREWLEKYP